MTPTEIMTIVALFAGPVFAVWLTRRLDDRRQLQQRKYDIFRTLMRTRKMPIHFDHVGALNLIEVEFIKDANVITAWKSYLANLSETAPPMEEKEKYDALVKKRDALLTKLLSEIAISLNITIEQLSILEGNYIPQGWVDDDWHQRLVQRSLLDVLTAKRALVIRADVTPQPSPYPPPPPPPPDQKTLGSD